MNTVFIGGSRRVSRLPAQVKERLNNMIDKGHRVFVGDANGADKAVQKHFMDAGYDNVTVFCSGDRPRNNLGQWRTECIQPPKNVTGFQFYAAKDRQMARSADFGLMIWDGKSPGTVLNVLRLVQAGKKAVLINVPDKIGSTFSSPTELGSFLELCSHDLIKDLRKRALPEEWDVAEIRPQLGLFEAREAKASSAAGNQTTPDNLTSSLNKALASGNPSLFVDTLGDIARKRGMTQIAKDAGLSRESLYRSLGSGGNPEFATVLKVLAVVGLRLEASNQSSSPSSDDFDEGTTKTASSPPTSSRASIP